MTAMVPDDPSGGPNQVVIQMPRGKAVVNYRDGKQIHEALMTYLRQSTISERDFLLRMTESVPVWIDPDGHLRVGGWLLQAKENELVLYFRMQSGQPATQAFVAVLGKTDGRWVIVDFKTERISPRR